MTSVGWSNLRNSAFNSWMWQEIRWKFAVSYGKVRKNVCLTLCLKYICMYTSWYYHLFKVLKLYLNDEKEGLLCAYILFCYRVSRSQQIWIGQNLKMYHDNSFNTIWWRQNLSNPNNATVVSIYQSKSVTLPLNAVLSFI